MSCGQCGQELEVFLGSYAHENVFAGSTSATAQWLIISRCKTVSKSNHVDGFCTSGRITFKANSKFSLPLNHNSAENVDILQIEFQVVARIRQNYKSPLRVCRCNGPCRCTSSATTRETLNWEKTGPSPFRSSEYVPGGIFPEECPGEFYDRCFCQSRVVNRRLVYGPQKVCDAMPVDASKR